MRGDIIHQLFGVHAGREKDCYFGAFRSPEAAAAEIAKLMARTSNGMNWAQRYHDKGFVVRPKTVETDFEFPSLPIPRHRYLLKCSPKPNRPGTWDSTRVEVLRRGESSADNQLICEYERNYGILQTFEPFRQGDREYALISRRYTQTAVLDLSTGVVIAEEGQGESSQAGFCPVGFYVPDWWDLHDGTKLPGSEYWRSDDEWPRGQFGFVWGCIWGDDSSWKVQYLNLSRVQEGIINRDERFGYLELATAGYTTPCLVPDSDEARKISRPNFIEISRYNGVAKATFAVEMPFDLESGKSDDWTRLKVANLE